MFEKENSDIVDNLRHPMALLIRLLLSRQGRIDSRQMLIDDEENIIQALQAGVAVKMLFTTDKQMVSSDLRTLLPANVSMIEIAKRTSKKIFGGERFSRTFAIADMPMFVEEQRLTQIKKDIIVLDKLSLSGNIGAIIRTSLALNAGAMVFLDTEHVDVYDRRIIRSSRGYVFRMPIITLSTSDFINISKTNKLDLLVTTPYTEVGIDKIVEHRRPLAIVFGSEKAGCSSSLLEAAILKAKIPINSVVESLNVSVAASIILYLRREFNK